MAPQDPFAALRRLAQEPGFLRQVREFNALNRSPAQEPAFLRQAREFNELNRRLSSRGVASGLERISRMVPSPTQTKLLELGTDVTARFAQGTPGATWLEAQAIHARIAELTRRTQPPGGREPLESLVRVAERLNEQARVLAHLPLPRILAGATSDSTHGFHLLVRESPERAATRSVALGGTFAVGTVLSARLLRPTIVEPIVLPPDSAEADPSASEAAVDANTIGEEHRAQLRAALEVLEPRLLERWDGAWATLAAGSPNAASQAAHSIQELIDWTLRLAAPDDRVLEWHRSEGRPDAEVIDGRPTRGLRVRFLLGARADDAAGKLFLGGLTKTVSALQQAKHGLEGPAGPIVIRSVLLNTESFLGFVLLSD